MKKDEAEKKPTPWEVSDPLLPPVRAEHGQISSTPGQEK